MRCGKLIPIIWFCILVFVAVALVLAGCSCFMRIKQPPGLFKLAHQFWFSYAPPGAGGSSNSKSAQTDEEKQRDRQRNEREQKQIEIDVANIKREKEAREARQLDFEIRRQAHQIEQRKKEIEVHKQHLHNHQQLKHHQQQQLQQQQHQQQLDTASVIGFPLAENKSHSTDKTSENSVTEVDIKLERSPSSLGQVVVATPTATAVPIAESRQDSPGGHTHDDTSSVADKIGNGNSTGVQSPQLISALAAVIGASLPLAAPGVVALRNDSTESDQSLTQSQSQSEALHLATCRAPIASLDCMEEFSGTGGHLDFGRSVSLGSNPALPLRHNTTTTPGLRYKNLGKSGLRVSNVGLGTGSVFSTGVTDDQAEAILKLAVESGINVFDISDPHAETELGKIVHKYGWKRTTFVVTTKIFWSIKSEERGLSRKHIIESVKASLQRLQLPYIDIVIIHKADSMCPMEEVVRAMNYVISQGWAMYWGTARWSQVEIMEAYTNCRQFNCITPIVEQAEYHMFCREKAELYLPEMYNKIGVGLMAWGPLSMALGDTQNGERLLFPKGSFKTKSHSYSWTEDEANRDVSNHSFGWNKDRVDEGRRHSDKVRDIANLAEKLGCSAVQLSIAWSLKHEPVQCLLLGATTADQLHQNLQALQLLPRLSTSVMLELERILDNKPVRPPPISTLALR